MTQRQLAIVNQQLGQLVIDEVLHHRCRSAIFPGLGNKVVAVAAAAGQGNEQTALGNLARINADTVKMGIHTVERGGQWFEQVGQAQRFKHEPPPTAAAQGWPVRYR